MKLLFISFVSAFALGTPPKLYVESQFFVDGKLVASPGILVTGNETSAIEQGSKEGTFKMKVSAIPETQDQVHLKFEIAYRAGGRLVKVAPEIRTRIGADTEVSLGPDLRMKIVAKRN